MSSYEVLSLEIDELLENANEAIMKKINAWIDQYEDQLDEDQVIALVEEFGMVAIYEDSYGRVQEVLHWATIFADQTTGTIRYSGNPLAELIKAVKDCEPGDYAP